MLQATKTIVKAPMLENASDVFKGILYIIASMVVFTFKLVGMIIILTLKAIYKLLGFILNKVSK